MCAGSWQCAVRSFSCEETQFADFDERRSAFLHFAGAKRRRAQQKSGFAPLQILLGNIAARIRSLNFVGKVTGVPVPVLAQTPLLGHPRAFQRYFAYQVPHSGRPCNRVTVTEPSEKLKVARKLAISRQSPPKNKGIHLIDSTCYANQDAVLNPCRNGLL